MTTMNREEQKQVLIDTANHVINRDNTSPYSENLRELARIALASLAAVSDERAAYELFMEKRFGESVDRRRAKNGDREYMAWDMALGWIIWCHRAAMLHCAEPASKHEELPLDYLQGQKDGLEWAAQLAEANHPQTGDWLYDDPLDLAKAIRKGPDIPEFAGPHPVTPDGWISCSDRMPEDTKMLLAFSQGEIVAAYWNWVVNPIDYKKYRAFTYLSGYILDDVTHWMPLPEPPQEVNRG
ncbi:DUF551 domain-containing protein [Escherichia coli]|nr:DUF551 domain-containing protein [Escherichia coli]EGW97025.1 hypothetical protein ECSTECEH250_1215 [Escherichia coli STEC_EH250]EZE33001.1 Eaa protein [Escherichia coli O91:NM str. 2009C-3745]